MKVKAKLISKTTTAMLLELEFNGKQMWFGNGIIKQISDNEFEIEDNIAKRLGLKEAKEEKKEEKKKEKKEE
jgi:hypothetical protein